MSTVIDVILTIPPLALIVASLIIIWRTQRVLLIRRAAVYAWLRLFGRTYHS